MAGRDAELQLIRARLAHPGGAVVVRGDAGIGKTRLIDEAAASAGEHGVTVLHLVGNPALSGLAFGAIAPLVPEGADTSNRLDLIRAVLRHIARTPHLLVVDDAHWLDEGSAAVVQQLMLAGACRLLIGLRSGEPVETGIAALWKDGQATRIHLRPLQDDTIDSLVQDVLGAPLDNAGRRRLRQLSGGNPLHLRELVDAALAAGELQRVGNTFRLSDRPVWSEGLDQLIGHRLDSAGPAALSVLQHVAIGGVLGYSQLEGLCGAEHVDAAERSQLIATFTDGARELVRPRHPLYAEVAMARCPARQRRSLCSAVAAAIEATGARRSGDVRRAAALRLEAGDEVSPPVLERALLTAMLDLDLALLERLARAAIAADMPQGRQFLYIALSRSGRTEEAELAAHDAMRHFTEPVRRVELATSLAVELANRGRGDDARSVLDNVRHEVPEDWAGMFTAVEALTAFYAGEPDRVITGLTELLSGRGSLGMVANAHSLEASALALKGTLTSALVSAEAAQPAPQDPMVFSQDEYQSLAIAFVEIHLGQPDKAITRCHGLTVDQPVADIEGRAQHTIGRAALVAGLPRTALEACAIAEKIHEAAGDPMGLAWVLGGRATAHAYLGDAVSAMLTLKRLDALPSRAALFEPELPAQGRAWALAVNGQLAAAAAVLDAAAAVCRSTGAHLLELLALHDIARLGAVTESVANRVAELARLVDGPLCAARALHVEAVTRRDVGALLDATSALADAGAPLFAAEAAAAAAGIHRAHGQMRQAADLDRVVDAHLERCEGARPPSLAGRLAWRLTSRESEIARMAAGGSSSKDIGSALHLSRRTVDNHLHRVYTKLGVSSRASLRSVLGTE